MPRVDDARAVTRRPLLRWAALCALLALAAILGWWQLTTPRAEPGQSTPVYALALSALLAAVIGWVLMRAQSQAVQVRQARIHLQALSDVLDVWQWRSDDQHRLTQLRPPGGAPGTDWTGAGSAQLLWEQFRPVDASGLKARMTNAASLDDIEVWRRTGDGRLCPAQLRGRPLVDARRRLRRLHRHGARPDRGARGAVPHRRPLPAAAETDSRSGVVQLHRLARPARADPRRRGLHAASSRKTTAACSTASATTTSTACSAPRRA